MIDDVPNELGLLIISYKGANFEDILGDLFHRSSFTRPEQTFIFLLQFEKEVSDKKMPDANLADATRRKTRVPCPGEVLEKMAKIRGCQRYLRLSSHGFDRNSDCRCL